MEESTIDLLGLAKALWKNILVIALVAVLVGSGFFGYAAVTDTPQYKATVSLYVNNSDIKLGVSNIVSSANLSSANYLVSTYLYILQSRTTLEDVIEEAGLNYTPNQLKGMIQAESVANTGAFEVTVSSADPAKAELIANTIAKVLPDRIVEIIDGSSVRVVDYAIIPARRSNSSVMSSAIKGILVGAVLGAAAVAAKFLLVDSADGNLKSADELRAMFPDLQVLAMIPDMRTAGKGSYYSSYYGPKDKKGGQKNNGK